jgi:hypothetical protein
MRAAPHEPLPPPAAALAACWPALPVLLAASVGVVVAGAACAGLAAGGAPFASAVTVAVLLGPAWALLAAVARDAVAGEVPRARALPALARDAAGEGLRLALAPAAACALVAASLRAVATGSALPFAVPLALNLVALGLVALVAPFAFAAGAARRRGARDAWRIGAGVSAASPRLVIGGLAVLVLVGLAVRLIGPAVLLLVPAPLAAVAAAGTADVLGGMDA